MKNFLTAFVLGALLAAASVSLGGNELDLGGGSIKGQGITVTNKTSSDSLNATSDVGQMFTNATAGAEVVLTLPTAAAGLTYTFYNMTTNGMQITAASGDTIEIDGAVSVTAGNIDTQTVGAHLTLTAIDGTQWLATDELPYEWQVDDTETGHGAHGEYYWSATANTATSGPTKAAGTTTALQTLGFSHASNKLTYNGKLTLDFLVTVSISMTKDGGTATTGNIHIAKNGSIVTGLNVSRTLANTSDVGSMAFSGTVNLMPTDYIEIYVETANDDDVDVQLGVVSIVEAGR